MPDQERLVTPLATRAAKRRQSVLASARTSTLYIDARLPPMSPEGSSPLGSLGLALLEERRWDVDSIGGLTLGADPIAYAISYASACSPRPRRAFTVRKEVKKHGTSKLI